MRPLTDDHAVARWLEAEAGGLPDEADRRFSGLAASGWGRVDVPPGLARRIAAALGAPQPAWWDLWWARTALLASLAAVGAVMAVVPSSALTSAGVSALVWWSHMISWLLAGSRLAVDTAWALWSAGSQISSWAGLVLSAPASQVVVAVNFAMAAAACLALRRLLRAEEIPS